MEEQNKVFGEKRRHMILDLLKESSDPYSGSILAQKMNVSRQAIVQDISLLKAKGEPIIATSRGYVFNEESSEPEKYSRIIAVSHKLEETATELYTLVDCGVTIRNVMVEHPIYGDLTGSLMVKNRLDVDAFLHELNQTGASLLANLTDGVHLHTIEADTESQLDKACQMLKNEGILLQ
ncbi:transcription repressor NadR [Lentibacillus amyloliquefaciens]|uniref:Transcriptional regulator n=1 Tax=Lentibacillus amyloliquefaciens TaxID=1472767 RepID=A0A0U4FDM4_9BACI|nr:transcription repressor NadR [Lentibacillus amyloliquefaciens]ALX48589.1 transcriptional regulator [Lentibacillus amyloliquefaciens]